MDNLKSLFRWEIVIYVVGLLVGLTLWYGQTNALNQAQDARLTQHETRIAALEQKQNNNDTQMAVIQVQLQAIQADLKDIKAELKKR